ncbi:hypothetical protein FH972_024205 [Carpinus fangiana]|uniref:VPS10 domain-containing protein n=1 Tax=Carpinus fangiana TaxID=176857 RepID=A0A5N6KY27_9ROSI|nr:hypothetical protein FH972_024205 [Carpinus fangiana]
MELKGSPTSHQDAGRPTEQYALQAVVEPARNEVKQALQDVVFGSTAGIIGKYVEYPFDTVKVRLQSQPSGGPMLYAGPLDCFQKSFRRNGVMGLYRGISAPLVGAAIETSSLFFSRVLSSTLYKQHTELPFEALLLSGAASGAFTSILLTPIELVKCKMQVPAQSTPTGARPPGPVQIIGSIFRQHGISGFWRGQLGTLIRETGGSAAWFGSFEGVTAAFKRLRPASEADTALPIHQQLLAGACAGMSYNFMFYPADTIKSCMQTEEVGLAANGTKRTFLSVGKALWKDQGLKGMYRGCGITVARAAPSSAFIFTIYEASGGCRSMRRVLRAELVLLIYARASDPELTPVGSCASARCPTPPPQFAAMRLSRLTGASMRLFILISSLISLSAAAADEPKVSRQEFDYRPSLISYFDDSDVVLTTVEEAGVMWRSDDAGVTWKMLEDGKDEIAALFMHPNDNKVAVAIGRERRHWITKDRGETWRRFETDLAPMSGATISFHATDSDKIIINTGGRSGRDKEPVARAVYTTNAFKDIETLRENAVQCAWAKEKPYFETGDDDSDDTRALCIVVGKSSLRREAYRMLISDNYFKDEHEPDIDGDRPRSGIVSMVSATRYILAAQMAEGSSEMAMFVTKDSKNWHRAVFNDQRIETDGFTIMESTNHSVRVDVYVEARERWQGSPMGMLFTSNSNGTYFTRNEVYTNRNQQGFADFERISNIQGIALINTVENHQEVLKDGAEKVLVSKISFDDGRTFQHLRTGEENLHLHSVTDMSNSGRVFSSPAPGLAMGIGNTGKSLLPYSDGDLYVSDNGGESWFKGLDGEHKYEFGDQGSILVAVYDGAPTDCIMYSLEHGKGGTWKTLDLDEEKFKPVQLTTIPDSTSKKFLLQAIKGRGHDAKNIIYTIDFGTMDIPKCKSKDFEKWYARYNETTDKPGCIMGHTQSFHRRKADKICFVDNDFDEPLPDNDNDDCECTDEDFECDFNFVRSEDRTECVPSGALQPPKDACAKDDETYEGPSGWRLIPGNTCKKEGGVDKEQPTKRPCKGASKPPPTDGKIAVKPTEFGSKHGEESFQYVYLARSQSESETILMTTQPDRSLFITQDHGKHWEKPESHGIEEEVLAIYPNKNAYDEVYFITNSDKVWYSKDRGEKMHHFKAPALPSKRTAVLKFHQLQPNWLIFIGCPESGSKEGPCMEQNAWYSTKGGEEWHLLLKGVESCEFMATESRADREKLVYCVAHENENLRGPKQLLSSEDWFEHSEKRFDDMVNFATMSDFIVVAKKDDDDHEFLNFETSVDGVTFSEAKFPPDFKVDHQTAYTVLDSSTGSIFVHVTTNSLQDQEYGSILKSNSNGTYYVRIIDYVNRDRDGYADFEKMLGLEGVSMVNQVANVEEVHSGSNKKVRSKMSFNDGADWSFIRPPGKDADDKYYECNGKKASEQELEKCSLNLHGYVDRSDYRDTLSSPSAVGIMIGVGNVGEYLLPKKDCDTFISNDGGITWQTAMKGPYMWEFGDQGSVIALVAENEPTNKLFYSRDEGDTWAEFEFTNEKVDVKDISTMPLDGSRNFLIWAHAQGRVWTFNIDFSPMLGEKCKFSRDKPIGETDYYLWTPTHPYETNQCLFGHEKEYYRKDVEKTCYNGPKIDQDRDLVKNCTCTRTDFECAYNYVRAADLSCQLIAGLEPEDPMAVCENKDTLSYYVNVAYRKIPMDTCQGGLELELGDRKTCPGKEEEYRKKHGISGAGLFFAIVVPILAAGGIGYFLWTQYESKFGRIRLGDGGARRSFDTASPWVAWPVAVLSAVAAGVLALPALLGTLYRTVSERFGRGGARGGGSGYRSARPYTSRDSFARGRGSYAAVGNVESDLLGEESDEDM